MPLAFRDFCPRAVSAPHSSNGVQWESVAVVVERASQWLSQAGLRAVNVETLLLPATKHAAPNSAAGGMTERWDEDHAWVQVVRVWHEVPPVGAPSPVVATKVLPTPGENFSGSVPTSFTAPDTGNSLPQ